MGRAARAADGAGDPAAVTGGGNRLYVVTGDALDVYDLQTRERLADFAIPGAQAVAIDTDTHQVYVGTAGGEVLVVDTAVPVADLAPVPFASPGAADGAPVERLWTVGTGDYVIAGMPGDVLLTIDAATAAELSRAVLPGRADLVDAGRVDAIVATPTDVPDPSAAAAEVARLVGGDEAAYRDLLARDAPLVILSTDLGTDRAALDQAIADGALTGVRVQDVPRIAVADAAGITFLEPASGRETGSVPLDAPATGIVEVEGLEDPTLYAASGDTLAVVKIPTADAAASLDQTVWMPGAVERITFNPASQLVHVLGRTPDGAASTVYVVEPRGNSVFADAALPFAPAAWATDVAAAYPATDRQQLLVFAPDGAGAAVDIGQNAFAWRLPGVLAGALMAGFLYLLARILFRRRAVAVLAGLFVLADGMLFAQSRIAMNDAYVALFIVAAVTLFAAIWTGAWRWRGAFWVGLPIVGLLLGLAFAAKWVALYAIGGIALLILLRSALGRALIVVGLGGIAASLGYMAIATGPESTGNGNILFLLLMIGLTIVAAAVATLHPVAWTVDEVRIAVVGPAAAGALLGLAAIPLGLGTPAMAAAVGLMALGGVAAGAFWFAGRLGLGPLAPPPEPGDPAALLEPAAPAPSGWLRPGWLAGLPIVWAGVCLIAIPLAVYVASYLPWAALGKPDRARLAAFRGADPCRPDAEHVRVPQQPAGDPRGILAVVGLAGQPQARLVLPGVLCRTHRRGHLRWRQPRHLVALDPRLRLRGLAGLPPPEPSPGARDDHVRRALAAMGADRPRHLPVPLLHGAAVRAPGAGLPRGGGLARSVAPDVGPRARRRRGRRAHAGRHVAAARPDVRSHRRREGEPGLTGLLRRGLPVGLAVGPAGGHPCRARRGGGPARLAAPGPRSRLAHARGALPRRARG